MHAARRVVGHPVSDPAEQVAPNAGEAAVTDDDEVGVDLLGNRQQHIGGVAEPTYGRHRE